MVRGLAWGRMTRCWQQGISVVRRFTRFSGRNRSKEFGLRLGGHSPDTRRIEHCLTGSQPKITLDFFIIEGRCTKGSQAKPRRDQAKCLTEMAGLEQNNPISAR